MSKALFSVVAVSVLTTTACNKKSPPPQIEPDSASVQLVAPAEERAEEGPEERFTPRVDPALGPDLVDEDADLREVPAAAPELEAPGTEAPEMEEQEEADLPDAETDAEVEIH